MTDSWHLYLLRCRDGSLYAGIATDVERRFRQHVAGKGARYTRAHPPECVLASRAYPDRGSALRAEYALKRQPKTRKLEWLTEDADAAPRRLAGPAQRKRCRSPGAGNVQDAWQPNQR